MLNTTQRFHALLILLVCGALFLPACGKKTEVKSQPISGTVLAASLTPSPVMTPQTSADISMSAEQADSMVNDGAEEEQVDPTDSSEDSESMDEVPMTKAARPASKPEPEAVKPAAEAAIAPATTEVSVADASSNTSEAMAAVLPEDSGMDVQAPAKKKSGLMNALLWMILIPVLIIGLIWFIWSMFHKRELPFQPAPPMGGLSPVSGFIAMKNKMKEESKPEVSFWNKKLF